METFAELTGDHGALHVSEAFARRSAYRRPVVHGMLPVGFIALIDRFRLEAIAAFRRNLGAFFRPGLHWRPARPFRRGGGGLQAREGRNRFRYVVRRGFRAIATGES